jgi:hypothetical protein
MRGVTQGGKGQGQPGRIGQIGRADGIVESCASSQPAKVVAKAWQMGGRGLLPREPAQSHEIRLNNRFSQGNPNLPG